MVEKGILKAFSQLWYSSFNTKPKLTNGGFLKQEGYAEFETTSMNILNLLNLLIYLALWNYLC